MKKIIFFLAIVFIACTKNDDGGNGSPSPAPEVKASTCSVPAEFKEAGEKSSQVSLADLKAARVGEFKAVKAVFRSKKVDANGVIIAERNGSVDMSEQTPAIIEGCVFNSQGLDAEISQSIPMKLFLPSQRLTVFDENVNQDNPSYNLPLIASVQMKGGLRIFDASDKSNIGESPYLKNRYLSELLKDQSDLTVYFLSPDTDKFEILYTKKQAGSPDSTQTVLIQFVRQ